MLIWWLIILPGFARPLTIKSRRYSLYFFTGSCPVPMVNPFSKKLARGNEKIPCWLLILCSRIWSDVNTDNTDTPGGIHHPKGIFQCCRVHGFMVKHALV